MILMLYIKIRNPNKSVALPFSSLIFKNLHDPPFSFSSSFLSISSHAPFDTPFPAVCILLFNVFVPINLSEDTFYGNTCLVCECMNE